MLSYLDIYARPIMLVKDGQKYKRSKMGGIATLVVAVLALIASVQFFDNSGFTSPLEYMNHEGIRRRLEVGGNTTRNLPNGNGTGPGKDKGTPADPADVKGNNTSGVIKAAGEGAGKSNVKLSDINFDNGSYFSDKNVWFSNSKYKAINMSEYDRPILASNRSGLDGLNLVFQSQGYKDEFETKMQKQGPLLKDVWLGNTFGGNGDIMSDNKKYLRIKQSIVYWPGSMGKSADELGLKAVDDVSEQLLQMNLGAYEVPVLRLGNIHVMGDPTSRNISQMKAYTKVEVQANMVALYEEAYNKVESWLADESDAGTDTTLDDLDDTTPASSGQTFTEGLAMDLINGHKDGIINFDEYYFKEKGLFKEELAEIIDLEKLQMESSEGLDPDPWFMNDLKSKIYKVVKGNNVKYFEKFTQELTSLVQSVFIDNGGMFFDQIQLQYEAKGSQTPQTLASSAIDTSCLTEVLGLAYTDPYAAFGSSTKCQPKQYYAKMQVQENYVQDVFVENKEDWKVNETLKMYDKLKISKFGKTGVDKSVGREAMGDVIGSSYNTLWSCIFILDPMKAVNTEIWLVQDDKAPRRSIQYLMQLKDRFLKRPTVLDSIMNRSWLQASVLKSTDFIGFIGGIIFILSAISQFFVSKINQLNKDKKSVVTYNDQIQMQQIVNVD